MVRVSDKEVITAMQHIMERMKVWSVTYQLKQTHSLMADVCNYTLHFYLLILAGDRALSCLPSSRSDEGGV